ncbi:hypothetical protein BJ684DRAFT_7178 [Piptocephalis cylindrospora]|uniref:Phospholipid-transporting ATPase n=1 Tax=Piptocephalis cylindrospora TaxID=1907219 RepID=A0A4P9Y8C1_9FUNG|nr:hypothetical protein BJ684DRAFT_7178 [Piptocephalis cylindrospora]|eukprot:RKP15323.1 hypothetical protein BJ684DRAFT_7178 [Piptocephalis cylindrospora]
MDDIVGARLERHKSAKSGRASLSRISTLYSTSRASTEGRRPEEIYEVEFQWPEDRPTEMVTTRTYPSNYIRTTKYTLWSFLPVNLFNQFRRFYNIYFLLAAIFVLVEPGLDPTSEIMPLCIVLLITAIKDGHEDYKRYRSDKVANQEVFRRLTPAGDVEDITSRHIAAGDIMVIRKGERIPADLMILGSSGEDGVCYVDTVELDGETSLKRRMAVPLAESCVDPKVISRIYGHIECELPNERLNAFEGIHEEQTKSSGPKGDIHPLGLDSLLLRGTFLRNTRLIYGVVVYAGSDTKIFKNLKQTGLKFSTLERKLNRMIIYIFVLNAILLIVSMCLAYINSAHDGAQSAWYLGEAASKSARDVVGVLMTFFVLYTFLIPISVFVSCEIIRLLQAAFMVWDEGMTSRGGKRMRVHNSNLNEDLGSVEYIFSDKTGTLTQNIMTLSRWWVQGVEYDEAGDPGGLGKALIHAREVEMSKAEELLREFCRCVALCHGTLPTLKDHMPSLPEPTYESPSPDETALLNGLRSSGIWLVSRSKDQLRIRMEEREEIWELLKVFEFSSDRKRMSVVVRNERGIFLYCKGADNVVLPRLSEDPLGPGGESATLERDLTRLSEGGLRTLVMAYRRLSEREWAKFSRHYEKAERALRRREDRMAKAAELIEKNLTLLGASAIEDKLQEDVPETISYLLEMDIRVWLLTGDKQETAIKIGKSSSLISRHMRLMTLNAKSAPDCSVALDEFIEEMREEEADGSVEETALVVNGESLIYVLLMPEITEKFLWVGTRCRSVICCRVTPLQKALVVRMVKKRLGKVTLSIGDGANDVSMIQEAHVGVGIEGMEGAQAVRASDYSFVEFRALRRLLSVHGRYSYLRMTSFLLFSFYKSIVFIAVQFWFGFESAWCAQELYIDQFLTLWNVVFTSAPPVAMACLDKDVDEERIAANPRLYREVKDGLYWNWWVEAGWGLASMYHSAVIFGIFVLAEMDGVMYEHGMSLGDLSQGLWVGTMVWLVVMGKSILLHHHWTWPSYLAFGATVILYLLIMYMLEVIGLVEHDVYGSLNQSGPYYFTLALALAICLLPDYVLK